MKPLESRMTEDQLEDHRLEIENRLRNLFWTVTGDYAAEFQPDVETYSNAPELALYLAIRQGALAKYLDVEQLTAYAMKKCAEGAEESALMKLIQLCADVAVYPLLRAERSGIGQIRRSAFALLLEDAPSTPLEKLRQWVIRHFLVLPVSADAGIQAQGERIAQLSGQTDTDRLITAIDTIYDALLAPSTWQTGSLDGTMAVTAKNPSKLRQHQALTDKQIDQVMKEYRSKLKTELLNMVIRPVIRQPAPSLSGGDAGDCSAPDPALREKAHAYIERQFGKSSLSRLEQDRINRRLCTGLHQRCSLYFTDGILSNPAIKNTQYLRTRMQEAKNEMYFEMKKNAVRRSIGVLSTMLKQAQLQQQEEDTVRAEYGQIRPADLWKVGRSRDNKLFDCRKKRESSNIVVDILLDSSGSETQRQPQIAVQAYLISQAFSNVGIPHRVSSFCSYWEYTIVHRFRQYDDTESSNRNILQFRAFGNNRDGLAIRAIVDDFKCRSEEKKILIILSDGRPNAVGLSHSGMEPPIPYVGELAVRDTALEVRKARNLGISVLGIFIGDEEDLAIERKIFGKEFVYTQKIESFAHIVGTYLRKQMEQD